MNGPYTVKQLESLGTESLVNHILDLQDEVSGKTDSKIDLAKDNFKLLNQVDDLNLQLLDLAKKLEDSTESIEGATVMFKLMNLEIDGHIAGIERRNIMVVALQKQIKDLKPDE